MKDALTTNQLVLVPLTWHTLDQKHVQQLSGLLEPLLKPGLRLALVCHEVQRADSEGVRTLIGLARQLRSRGGEIKMCLLSPPLRSLFQVLGLHHEIEMYNSISEVECAFRLQH